MLKGWRTVIFNALAVVPPVLDFMLPILMLPQWEDVVPAHWWAVYSLVVAIINIGLRGVTTTPVGRKS